MQKATKIAAPSAPPTTGNVFRDMVVFGRADTEVAQLVVEFAECISQKRLGVDAAASLVEIDAQDLAKELAQLVCGQKVR
jgi:hypothetical protein